MTQVEGRDWWAVIRAQEGAPWGFLKALVANGIDSWSAAVHVNFGEDDQGNYWYEIKDFGEGMGLSAITDSLLAFPASTRSEDLLYLGNEGTGFASLFSEDLLLAVVESGFRGVYTRTLITPDGKYRQFRLDYPVDGTRVLAFYPPGSQRRPVKEAIVRELVRTMGFCPVPVFVMGDPINRPFSLAASPFETVIRQEEERFVLGFSSRRQGMGKMYCHGMFQFSVPSPLPWIDFLIDSPYLTSHGPFQDESLEAVVETLVGKIRDQHGPVFKERFLQYVRGFCAGEEAAPELGELLPFLPRVFVTVRDHSLLDIPAVPGPRGVSFSPRDILMQSPCYYTKNMELGAALAVSGKVVIDGNLMDKPLVQALLASLGALNVEVTEASMDFALFSSSHVSKTSPKGMLIRAFEKLMGQTPSLGWPRGGVCMGSLPGSSSKVPWFCHDCSRIVSLDHLWECKKPASTLVLVEDHPVITDIMKLCERDMALGLFFLAKAVLLSDEKEVVDQKLLESCRTCVGATPSKGSPSI
ncbi:ATP-binding protein [Myxococcota bacterium]|nr:ATP-binding protein [Myxococcota bacterium]